MDHLDPFRRRVRSAAVADAPQPWTRVAVHAVGGLIGVGYADDSDLLLVVSSQGRGVVDCRTGLRVARDRTEPDDSWCCVRDSRAKGIGPLQGHFVRLAGLNGGGLLTSGREGWSVESLPLDCPDVSLLLVEPWQCIFNEGAKFTKLAVEREVRAFGFSDTGSSLVLATSSDVTVFAFQESPRNRAEPEL